MFRDRRDEWYEWAGPLEVKNYRYIHNYMPTGIYAANEYYVQGQSLQSWANSLWNVIEQNSKRLLEYKAQ